MTWMIFDDMDYLYDMDKLDDLDEVFLPPLQGP